MRCERMGRWQGRVMPGILSVLLVLGMGGCSVQPAGQRVSVLSDPAGSAEELRQTLDTIFKAGEDAYKSAKAEDWEAVQAQLNTLSRVESDIEAKKPRLRLEFRQIRQETALLAEAAQFKRRLNAMQAANQITVVTTDMRRSYPTPVPAEISLLDYYGRELEIGSLTHDKAKLNDTAAKLTQTWNLVKPDVKRLGPQEAARLQGIIEELNRTAAINRYAQLASDELVEVGKLKTLFRNQ